MRRSCLFVYNDSVGTREQITSVLNRMTTVMTWRYDLPNCIYIISDHSADDISKEFERVRGSHGLFIFLEYNQNSQGRMTRESWYLLNNKWHQPK